MDKSHKTRETEDRKTGVRLNDSIPGFKLLVATLGDSTDWAHAAGPRAHTGS